MNINQIYNEDCQEGIKRIPTESIDCILTDPPYLYLKGQKLDRPFDERSLFAEFKRVLKPTGFVVLFGRGTSFYRWNTILEELGFVFKEEIVWNKGRVTSPMLSINRVHETISVLTKKNGKLNKSKVPYLEMKRYNIESICVDLKRICAALNNPIALKRIQDYLDGKPIEYIYTQKTGITLANKLKKEDPAISTLKCMDKGMSEKTIIKEPPVHYAAIHPTQKPVRLLERLLALTTHPGYIALDPFAGSCSTAIACVNTNRKFIGFEIDKEYYDAGVKRLNEALSEPKLAM